jgi:hypothetical protein
VAAADSIWIARYEMNGKDFISLPWNERNPMPPLHSCLPTVFTSLCVVVAHFSSHLLLLLQATSRLTIANIYLGSFVGRPPLLFGS